MEKRNGKRERITRLLDNIGNKAAGGKGFHIPPIQSDRARWVWNLKTVYSIEPKRSPCWTICSNVSKQEHIAPNHTAQERTIYGETDREGETTRSPLFWMVLVQKNDCIFFIKPLTKKSRVRNTVPVSPSFELIHILPTVRSWRDGQKYG